ncbi:MAG: PIN domain-containing protein [Deltaproteobacteria bacterium]|nr:PIN domain-containing protein [Deltaproteobacteria bacterium]
MIYIETSVVLAQLLAEDRHPPDHLWNNQLVSSRLTEYEVWARINARRLRDSHADAVRVLLQRLAWLELTTTVLSRALEPWPAPVRTLDALHLASIEFLRSQAQQITLASYGERLVVAATLLQIPVFHL